VKVDQFFKKASTSVKKASASVAQLQLDRSVKLTLGLLAGVLTLGLLSAIVGFLFGHESLKGVTQPDMNPFVGTANPQRQYPRQGTYLLKETDILAKVERQTKNISKPDEQKKPAQTAEKKDPSKTATSSPSPAPKTSLPITVQSQGMRLDVRSLAVDGNGMTLEVTMQNGGAKEVQFLYDFLDISDDQSLFLSTEVKGLPTKFAAKSESFNGVIKILGTSADSIKWLSLSLADYPDQKIELKIPKILLKK
jgi:hypothetical protein